MIDVLVVDDDFRVAGVHTSFVNAVPGFRVVGTARSGTEALAALISTPSELVLLDSYLPDVNGVDLLPRLGCDVMMVTADRSAETVRLALARGAVNYILKPFHPEVLAERLAAYARYRRTLDSRRDTELSQESVDKAMLMLRAGDRPPAAKGQSTATSRLIADLLRDSPEEWSAAAVADRLGIARGTAQRYLAALTDEGRTQVRMQYGSTGRPEHRYTWSAPPA